MLRSVVLIAVAGMVAVGCDTPGPRLNAPPHGQTEKVSNLRDQYEFMIDNALLADMSISDVHFYPHRALLSPLGEERLCRLAALMEMYGGEIRYTAADGDETLVNKRTQTIIDFLQAQGIAVCTADVVHDLPGGRGMEASSAILIRADEGMYKPKKGAGAKTETSSTGMTTGGSKK